MLKYVSLLAFALTLVGCAEDSTSQATVPIQDSDESAQRNTVEESASDVVAVTTETSGALRVTRAGAPATTITYVAAQDSESETPAPSIHLGHAGVTLTITASSDSAKVRLSSPSPQLNIEIEAQDLLAMSDQMSPAHRAAIEDLLYVVKLLDGNVSTDTGDLKTTKQKILCVMKALGLGSGTLLTTLTCSICFASLVAEPVTIGTSTITAVPSCIGCAAGLGVSAFDLKNLYNMCR